MSYKRTISDVKQGKRRRVDDYTHYDEQETKQHITKQRITTIDLTDDSDISKKILYYPQECRPLSSGDILMQSIELYRKHHPYIKCNKFLPPALRLIPITSYIPDQQVKAFQKFKVHSEANIGKSLMKFVINMHIRSYGVKGYQLVYIDSQSGRSTELFLRKDIPRGCYTNQLTAVNINGFTKRMCKKYPMVRKVISDIEYIDNHLSVIVHPRFVFIDLCGFMLNISKNNPKMTTWEYTLDSMLKNHKLSSKSHVMLTGMVNHRHHKSTSMQPEYNSAIIKCATEEKIQYVTFRLCGIFNAYGIYNILSEVTPYYNNNNLMVNIHIWMT